MLKREDLKNLTTWLFEPESFTPVAKLTPYNTYSIVPDHLGTPLLMYNPEGEEVWNRELSIYGKVRKLKGWREACPFMYPGQYEDLETGLCYNRFRYYDPESGGYISQDPIGLVGGASLYGYVHDANSYIDIFGLSSHACSNADDAARRVLPNANKLSIKHNREFGGFIYESNGKYFATKPIPGSSDKFKPADALPQVPKDANIVGDYHTHGDYSKKVGPVGKEKIVRTIKSEDMLNSDEFSLSDRMFNMNMANTTGNSNYSSYLGTPSGQFKKLHSGMVSTL